MASGEHEVHGAVDIGPDNRAALVAPFPVIDERLSAFQPMIDSVAARYHDLIRLQGVPETVVFLENDGVLALMDRFGVCPVLDTVAAEYAQNPHHLNPHSLVVYFIPDTEVRHMFYDVAARRVQSQSYPKSWLPQYIYDHATEELRRLDSHPADTWVNKNAARELGALLSQPLSRSMIEEVLLYAAAETGTLNITRLATAWDELYQEQQLAFRAVAMVSDIRPQVAACQAELIAYRRAVLAGLQLGMDALRGTLTDLTELPDTYAELANLITRADTERGARITQLYQAVEARLATARKLMDSYDRFLSPELFRGIR